MVQYAPLLCRAEAADQEPWPAGPSLCAEAQRAKATEDGVQGKGCPLPLGKKIFDFRTSLDPFLDHFLQFFSFLSHLFTYKLSFHFFPAATPPPAILFCIPCISLW